MSNSTPTPADTILRVYGIAVQPAVAERLNASVTRMLERAAPLLERRPCEFDGFDAG